MTVRISFPEIPGDLIGCLMSGENYVNSVGLDAKLLELIRFYVSEINGCGYCIDMHYKEGINAGEQAQRLYSVSAFEETGYYSSEERAILKWTRAVTLPSETHDTQELFDQLSEFFSKEVIANITMTIIQINAWNRLAKSFGFEPGSYEVGKH